MDAREPESCTIELITGTRIYVAHKPSEVQLALEAGGVMTLVPMSQPGKPRNADAWPIFIQAAAIVAIYPLDRTPAESRVTLVSIERPWEQGRAWRGETM